MAAGGGTWVKGTSGSSKGKQTFVTSYEIFQVAKKVGINTTAARIQIHNGELSDVVSQVQAKTAETKAAKVAAKIAPPKDVAKGDKFDPASSQKELSKVGSYTVHEVGPKKIALVDASGTVVGIYKRPIHAKQQAQKLLAKESGAKTPVKTTKTAEKPIVAASATTQTTPKATPVAKETPAPPSYDLQVGGKIPKEAGREKVMEEGNLRVYKLDNGKFVVTHKVDGIQGVYNTNAQATKDFNTRRKIEGSKVTVGAPLPATFKGSIATSQGNYTMHQAVDGSYVIAHSNTKWVTGTAKTKIEANKALKSALDKEVLSPGTNILSQTNPKLYVNGKDFKVYSNGAKSTYYVTDGTGKILSLHTSYSAATLEHNKKSLDKANSTVGAKSVATTNKAFTGSKYDVPDNGAKKFEADTHYKSLFKPMSTFTPSEESSIDAYQDGAYQLINNALWGAGYKETSTSQRINSIDSAMNKSKTPESMISYRSVGGAHPMHSMLQQINPGDHYVAKGYDSSSISNSFGYKGASRVQYRVPPGVKAIYMNARPYSTHSNETELLFARNTRWRMIEKVVHGDGSIHAVMEFVSQD